MFTLIEDHWHWWKTNIMEWETSHNRNSMDSFLDLSKAFDLVNNTFPLLNLKSMAYYKGWLIIDDSSINILNEIKTNIEISHSVVFQENCMYDSFWDAETLLRKFLVRIWEFKTKLCNLLKIYYSPKNTM